MSLSVMLNSKSVPDVSSWLRVREVGGGGVNTDYASFYRMFTEANKSALVFVCSDFIL